MRFTRSETGSALIEFSLIVPLVVLMFIGVVDFGVAIIQAMTVEDAARAGAEYGTLIGKANDAAGMQSAATNAANGLSGFKATATTWCSCSPGGGMVSCSATCSNYGNPIEYVQVKTSSTVQILFGYPGFPTSLALSGVAVLRVQ